MSFWFTHLFSLCCRRGSSFSFSFISSLKRFCSGVLNFSTRAESCFGSVASFKTSSLVSQLEEEEEDITPPPPCPPPRCEERLEREVLPRRQGEGVAGAMARRKEKEEEKDSQRREKQRKEEMKKERKKEKTGKVWKKERKKRVNRRTKWR